MSKTVQEFQAKRVVFDTSLSFDEVTTRLNHELNRDKGGPRLFQLLGTVKSPDCEHIASVTKREVQVLRRVSTPQLARCIVGLNVPPRVLVVEKADKSGTQVVYLQPSSIIAIPVDGEVDREFVAAAQAVAPSLVFPSRLTAGSPYRYRSIDGP